jgi:hypothetical protein
MDSMLCFGKKMKNEWLVKNKNKMSVNFKNNSPSPFYTPPISSLNLPPSEENTTQNLRAWNYYLKWSRHH